MNLNSLYKGYIGVFFSWALAAGLFYPGIIFLMFLESCAIPISSEVVLMVSGFLSGEGKINFYHGLVNRFALLRIEEAVPA